MPNPEMTTKLPTLLTEAQAAKKLGIDRETLRRWRFVAIYKCLSAEGIRAA